MPLHVFHPPILPLSKKQMPISKTYVWALDLSLSMQGAGGVGGLLSATEASSGDVYYYAYDANGNVTELVDGSGNLSAHYEYGPFGKLVSQSGSASQDNVFKFSTKYQDPETDLYYYGYRYYDADMGRWLNRDPIEEKGGANLYGFAGNQTLNTIDVLGLCRIFAKCELKNETGDCDKNCEYVCTEQRREQGGFGPNTPCAFVPEPYTYPKEETAEGFSLMGCCLNEGECKESFEDRGTVGGADFECCKSECESSCKNIFIKCPPISTPAGLACRAAKKACLSGCSVCNDC